MTNRKAMLNESMNEVFFSKLFQKIQLLYVKLIKITTISRCGLTALLKKKQHMMVMFYSMAAVLSLNQLMTS